MNIRTASLALVFALSSCAGGGTGDPEMDGVDVTNPAGIELEAQSGVRLKAEWIVGTDGSRQFHWFFDTVLERPCRYQSITALSDNEDGYSADMWCVPIDVATLETAPDSDNYIARYNNAECDPGSYLEGVIALVYDDSCLEFGVARQEWILPSYATNICGGRDGYPATAWSKIEIVDTSTTTVYRLNGDDCVVDDDPGAIAIHLTTVHEDDIPFARATLHRDP